MSVCGCCGVPYSAATEPHEHHKECIWFNPRLPTPTQNAFNLGKYAYYAKRAKGDNYVFNPTRKLIFR